MIYLDNAATTRPFDEVIETMAAVQREQYFNPSAQYLPAFGLEKQIDAIREEIAASLGNRRGHIMFTSGATESNNTALNAAPEGEILISAMEHPSVSQTAEHLKRLGRTVKTIPVCPGGQVDREALAAMLGEQTALVSIMLVNNETGAVQDAAALGALIHRLAPKALFHVDAVQGYLRVPFSWTNAQADLISLSSHKIHGPKGMGALAFLKAPPVFMQGGGQENGLRSGTVNAPAILGFGQAVRMHRDLADHSMELKLLLWDRLREGLDRVAVNGPDPAAAAPHILNLSFEGIRGEVFLHALEENDVMVSTGSACSSHSRRVSSVLLAQGVSPQQAEGAIRISLSPMTTKEEIEQAAAVIIAQVKRLRHFRRR